MTPRQIAAYLSLKRLRDKRAFQLAAIAAQGTAESIGKVERGIAGDDA